MEYSEIDSNVIFTPKPKLNGGLYTGEAFNGPWKNTYVVPDAIYMTNQNLRSANPPQNALTQYGDIIRPGNNNPKLSNVHKFSNQHNIICTGSFKSFNVSSYDPLDNVQMQM